jgi:PEP-CTERM motif
LRLLAAVVLCVVPSAWGAAIIGSTVTGDLNFGNPTNYYDPGNGFVPGSGYLNSSGNQNSPTVVINAGLPTFGFNDTANLDVADFSSGTQLVFTDFSFNGGPNGSITLTFTDTAFTTITLSSNNFPGMTFGIVGDVITINIPGQTTTTGQTYTAAFDLVAAPEPATFAMMAAGSAVLIFLRRKKA